MVEPWSLATCLDPATTEYRAGPLMRASAFGSSLVCACSGLEVTLKRLTRDYSSGHSTVRGRGAASVVGPIIQDEAYHDLPANLDVMIRRNQVLLMINESFISRRSRQHGRGKPPLVFRILRWKN